MQTGAQGTLATRMAIVERSIKASPRHPTAGLLPPPGDLPGRVLLLVGAFRALVATALVAVFLLDQSPPILGYRYPGIYLPVSLAYLLGALVFLGALRQQSTDLARLCTLQVITDVIAVTVLMSASGGITSGLGGLLVVFVGASAFVVSGRTAFFGAALAALAILGEHALSWVRGSAPTADFLSAGLLGAMIFVLVVAVHTLARRAAETEAIARQRGIDLANLAQLNDYIIQNLRESIVVVDPQDRIRLINQSAAEHLGVASRDSGQHVADASGSLAREIARWREGRDDAGNGNGFIAADGTTLINTHMAPLDDTANGPVLIFLEDSSLLAQKVQQSKLAALGRLSASIAHEIRNPVGAISHAGQLLGESEMTGEQEQRLIDIIQTNSTRVSEIIDNVMQLSRRDTTSPELLHLGGWCRDFVAEFTSTLELFEGQLAIVENAEDVEVRMDPSHLRQVVWNLCENALKYASEAAGGISVRLNFGRMPANRRPFLEVIDQGPGIPETLKGQIFEPFATGRTGGTGLGLFISRELCECNRAALLHEEGQPSGSIFRIIFSDPGRWET